MVTVLIPVHEATRRWLNHAIASVHAQTFQGWTLMVLDGDEPLTVKLKKGAEEVTTKWIARLDADDWMLPNRLERQVQMATDAGFHVLGSNTIEIDEQQNSVYHKYPLSHLQCKEALSKWRPVNPIAHSSVLMRTQAVIAAGNYNAEWEQCQDLELWMRMMKCGYRFGNVDEYLTVRRVHPGQVSSRSWRRRLFQYRAVLTHKMSTRAKQ